VLKEPLIFRIQTLIIYIDAIALAIQSGNVEGLCVNQIVDLSEVSCVVDLGDLLLEGVD
jgi:hypothetical protein